MAAKRRITQHKRFIPNGTHPNFAFGETSFMLGTLDEIAAANKVIQIVVNKDENNIAKSKY